MFCLLFGIVSLSSTASQAIAQPVHDDKGVIMFDYHGVQRKVYNPLNVASGGLTYFSKYQSTGDKQFREYFLNTVKWLVDNAKEKQQLGVGGTVINYSVWEYNFPWRFYGWISPPYSSSLAQATGIAVLTHAYELTGNETFLDVAKKAFGAFLVDYSNGGVISVEKDDHHDGESVFFHLLAKPDFPKIYVLNGHTGSLLYIWEYYKKSNDTRAKDLFDKGIRYLKENLWKYDTGSWSLYDQMEHLASDIYHKAHINHLERLYDISGQVVLKEYADRFKRYLVYQVQPEQLT